MKASTLHNFLNHVPEDAEIIFKDAYGEKLGNIYFPHPQVIDEMLESLSYVSVQFGYEQEVVRDLRYDIKDTFMKKEKSLLEYLKALPEGSTLDIVDESTHEPLDYYFGASGRFLGEGKDATIFISKLYEPTGIYDIKLLSGISCLAERWKQFREDYYQFACKYSDDDRWQDESFRNHMYNQYVNTDRPITDQLYNLDDLNLKTLFRFIKEDLCGGDAERVRAI